MKNAIRSAIDFAVILTFMRVVWDAYGPAWGIVAGALVAVYGLWCFNDGLSRA